MADLGASVSIESIEDVKSNRVTLNYSVSIGDETEVIFRVYYKKSSNSTFVQAEEFTFTQNVSHNYTVENLDYNTSYDFKILLRDTGGNLIDESVVKTATTGEPKTESLGAFNVNGTQATFKARILDAGDSTSINANFQYREVGTSTWTDIFGPEITSLEPRDPDDFSNLSGWYDFSITETSYDSGGNLVPSVPDQGGSNNLFKTSLTYPVENTVGGYDCMTFDGESNIMTAKDTSILGNSFTVVAVMKVTDGSNPNAVWGQWGDEGGVFAQVHGSGSTGLFGMNVNGDTFGVSTSINTTDLYILTWVKDFNEVRAYVNGAIELDDSTTNLEFPKSRFIVGSANEAGAYDMEGSVFYLTAYNRALNDRERQGVEKKLSNDFGISITETADLVSTPYTYERTTDLPNTSDKYEFRSYFYDGTTSYISDNVYPVPGMGYIQDITSTINFEDNNDTYYYDSMEVSMDYNQVKNYILVFGEDQEFDKGEPLTGKIGIAEDSTSQSDYGTKEYIEVVSYETDSERSLVNRLQERADSILNRYKDPIKRIRFETSKPGLTGGMLISVNSASRDINDTFIIEEVNATLNRQNAFVYEVKASSYKRPGLKEFIKKI